MRYIVNDNNYVVAVSFGSDVVYNDCICTEYTGSVPSGWNTLEEWFEDEGEKLWRWKITNGNLVLDSKAPAPEEGQWGVPELQSKTVSPATTEQVVTADSEYDGLEKVTVKAAKLQYIYVGSSPAKQYISPDNGYYGFSGVTVNEQQMYEECLGRRGEFTSKSITFQFDKFEQIPRAVIIFPSFNTAPKNSNNLNLLSLSFYRYDIEDYVNTFWASYYTAGGQRDYNYTNYESDSSEWTAGYFTVTRGYYSQFTITISNNCNLEFNTDANHTAYVMW